MVFVDGVDTIVIIIFIFEVADSIPVEVYARPGFSPIIAIKGIVQAIVVSITGARREVRDSIVVPIPPLREVWHPIVIRVELEGVRGTV